MVRFCTFELDSFCLSFVFADSVPAIWSLLRDEVFGKPKESAKILIPALLYTMQNNLLFLALSNLDAATFQVCLLLLSAILTLTYPDFTH